VTRAVQGRPGHRIALVLALVAGVLALAGAWSLSTPVGSGPDEPAHIQYAYGVATGQTVRGQERLWQDSRGAWLTDVEVPAALFDFVEPGCYAFDTTKLPACGVQEQAGQPGTYTASTYMSRYPPPYYLLTGSVMRAALAAGLPGEATLLLARFASGVLALGLVVAGAAVLRRRFPGTAAALAVLAVVTPATGPLFGIVNPNGTELGAAVLAAAAVAVFRDDVRRVGRVGAGTWTALVVGLLVLAWSRPLSLAWVGVLLLVAFLPLRRTWEALRGRRSTLVGGGLLVLGLAACAAWLLYASRLRGAEEQDPTQDWSEVTPGYRVLLVLLHFGALVQQAVTQFGWDVTLPTVVLVVWLLAVAVAGTALALGGRGASTTLRVAGGALGGSALVVAVYSLLTGFGWQGRYWLPAVAAAVVLAVPALDGALLPDVGRRRLTRWAAGTFLALGAFTFLWSMSRYVHGIRPLFNRFDAVPVLEVDAVWWPPGGQLPTVALYVAGTAVLATLLLRGTSRPPAPAAGPLS